MYKLIKNSLLLKSVSPDEVVLVATPANYPYVKGFPAWPVIGKLG